jgi:hypothetical protein
MPGGGDPTAWSPAAVKREADIEPRHYEKGGLCLPRAGTEAPPIHF